MLCCPQFSSPAFLTPGSFRLTTLNTNYMLKWPVCIASLPFSPSYNPLLTTPPRCIRHLKLCCVQMKSCFLSTATPKLTALSVFSISECGNSFVLLVAHVKNLGVNLGSSPFQSPHPPSTTGISQNLNTSDHVCHGSGLAQDLAGSPEVASCMASPPLLLAPVVSTPRSSQSGPVKSLISSRSPAQNPPMVSITFETSSNVLVVFGPVSLSIPVATALLHFHFALVHRPSCFSPNAACLSASVPWHWWCPLP